jgi:phenylpropionate dioxygenase-like ring-hydroxylating dioxygenase large terminal subunit
MKVDRITGLVEQQAERHSLQRAFYHDPDIFEREIERIYLNAWLYAGHVSEIPETGDWFLFEFAGESVIIVNSGGSEFRALLNVCRHRGSRICFGRRGRSRNLRCRYHGWAYDLQGRLLSAAHMPEGFNPSEQSLQAIHLECLEGMIFVNFAGQPASFKAVREALENPLAPYGLANAKVAHRQSYPIRANWKLAVENYCECYHCAPSHPEYSRGHSLAKPGARESELDAAVMARAAACGLSDARPVAVYASAPGFGADFAFNRYPLWKGHVTGSPDGKAVAPLLGDVRDYDGGATDLQVGPVSFGLIYCDHVVLYRFMPMSQELTDCDISWLVRGDAEDGRDYMADRLTWLWDVTTRADKEIIERNQEGVNSRFYRSGPLSNMEEYTWQFLSWYLAAMK